VASYQHWLRWLDSSLSFAFVFIKFSLYAYKLLMALYLSKTAGTIGAIGGDQQVPR
jgi:hypothetical protein